MTSNPLRKVAELGQSIWLDFLRRHLIESGELQELIDQDGLRGMTSNPKIFQKAIGGSDDYDESIRALAHEGKSVDEIYRALTVGDVQRAADRFRPLYEESDGRHGFVSLEVSPHLARKTDETVAEARALWRALDRQNVFIKVPATREGLPAITQLIADGINVNVTLLFGLPRYREVADAYLSGLQQRRRRGEPIERVASVASFFLSRIDVLVDSRLEDRMKAGGAAADAAKDVHGQVAIACARVAYQIYKEIYAQSHFRALAEHGGHPQRLLWASTSTKNPAYSDVKYVEALIGPETINTMPGETLNAYRDHGDPAPRLTREVDRAHRILDRLADLGIDLEQVTQQLEDEGIEKFNKPFDELMDTLKDERQAALAERPDRQSLYIGDQQAVVDRQIAVLGEKHFAQRLSRKDPSLWKRDAKAQTSIRGAMGWLAAGEIMESNLAVVVDFAREVHHAGFQHVVHMGMGGSSLAPLTFQRTLHDQADGLPVTVLDTTDPETILNLQRTLPLADTLFIVASKSGTTAETRAFAEYFYEKVRDVKGNRAGENFVAITDADTPLAALAEERHFRRCFINMSDVGGRYSALTYFGLVPAALQGVDIEEVLARASLMVHACSSCVPIERNPGVVLGAALGELAQRGRNKVTFLMPQAIATLGMWIEQLLAESTGKEGKGLVPVVGEPVGQPMVYGQDRLFVHFRLDQEAAPKLEEQVTALQDAGHPVIRITLRDRFDIAQEFFRWQIATATAGAVLGINPFDQPNVQESKGNTARLLKQATQTGRLPEEQPALVDGSLRIYTDSAVGDASQAMEHFFSQAREGDYVALQAFVTENAKTHERLQHAANLIRDGVHVATTLGYGPRFLHSTGQLHKGGPNVGLFLALSAGTSQDATIPGCAYSFGTMQRAQALGDGEALRQHHRRVLRIDLGAELDSSWEEFAHALESALNAAALPQKCPTAP